MISNLERAFGFEHPDFGNYMLLKNTRQTTPSALMELSSSMAVRYNHPLVLYAAGWAAAEAATFRINARSLPDEDQYSIGSRLKALEKAQTHWDASIPALAAERGSDSTERAADFLGFELRAYLALAHVPSLQLVAKWRSSTESLEPQAVENALEKTKRNVLALGSIVTRLAATTPAMAVVKLGFCYEVTADLLLQDKQRAIIPASVRQDNNRYPALRGDLIEISACHPHAGKLIQVSPEELQGENKVRFVINPKKDLTLGKFGTPLNTLRLLVGQEKDDRFKSRTHPNELSAKLLGRLSAFGKSGYA